MYKEHWKINFDPFKEKITAKNSFESNDFVQAQARFEYLKQNPSLAVLTGQPGSGKTHSLRCFVSTLPKNLFKVVYIPLSTVTVLDFYKSIAYGLGTEVSSKKVTLFRSIQERIISLSKDKKVVPVIIIDEAQYLKTEVLNDIKLLLNFSMDSKNYALMILAGQEPLGSTLNKSIHESLKQRIAINFNYSGIDQNEVPEYINTRIKLCGGSIELFDDNALESIKSCCEGSFRVLNNLLSKSLMIGAQKQASCINTDIVMMAQNEVELA